MESFISSFPFSVTIVPTVELVNAFTYFSVSVSFRFNCNLLK